MPTPTTLAVRLIERGLVPTPLIRLACRALLRRRLAKEAAAGCEIEIEELERRIASFSRGVIARVPEKANEQHYELPPEFMALCLGPHRKYSCCLWEADTTDLAAAERRALEVTCARAELAEGQRILELGCGWGSLSLWMAEHYPSCSITSVSNSHAQRATIEAEARRRGLHNLRVITCDMNDFDPGERFDRIVSVEMFEHMNNMRALLERISTWLEDDGKLFVHVFCHRRHTYAFDTTSEDDFIGRTFFTGGFMPSDDFFLHFQEHLRVTRRWRWSGRHYQQTANAWLANLDRNRELVMPILAATYGPAEARTWFHRWRVFFIACAELWGARNGNEWWVSHTLFTKQSILGSKLETTGQLIRGTT